MYHYEGIIIGPLDTPYENGVFPFNMDLPTDYPMKPPKIQFNTKIFHPNIFPNGYICLSILKEEWSAALAIRKTLLSVQSLFNDPNPNDPSNPEAAHYYRFDREKYNQIAREWTNKYANQGDAHEKVTATREVIRKEFNEIQHQASCQFNVYPIDERDPFICSGTIIGPQDSPYRGRDFRLSIRFPLDYPNTPPIVILLTFIFHPCIKQFQTINEILLQKPWDRDSNLSNILRDFLLLLSSPPIKASPTTYIECLYMYDHEDFKRAASECKDCQDEEKFRLSTTQSIILKELTELEKDSQFSVSRISGDNIFEWKVAMRAPNDTPYEGQDLNLEICFPDDYPFKQPKIKFETSLFHPNVSSDTGYFCEKCIATQWKWNLTISKLLLLILTLLSNPDFSNTINQEAADLFQQDRKKFTRIASQWPQNETK